jgi:hypothetical protein
MHDMHAQVRNGHLVIDEPTDLPEGTVVELKVLKMEDPWADMDPKERAELEESTKKVSVTSSVATSKTPSPTPSNFWRIRSERRNLEACAPKFGSDQRTHPSPIASA